MSGWYSLRTQSRSSPRATSRRQAGEQEAVGDHQLALPQRRQDDLLDAMAEIGAVQQRELLGAQRVHGLPAL